MILRSDPFFRCHVPDLNLPTAPHRRLHHRPVLGISLFVILRVFHSWRYMPLVFAAVFLLVTGAFGMGMWHGGGR